MQDEIDRAQREGFGVEEVADAKRALLQQRRLARSQDATLAAALNEQSFVGRTFDYSAKLDAALEGLDAAGGQRGAAQIPEAGLVRQRLCRRFREGEKTPAARLTLRRR